MIRLILYLFGIAYIHALWECQIENREGWARNLPCWRLNVFIIKFLLGKELSGYHFYMFLLFLSVFHLPYLFIEWSLKTELLIMSAFTFYWIGEDFIWFLVNKNFGLKSFRPGKISWHKRWFLNFIPVSYVIGIIIGTVLLILGR